MSNNYAGMGNFNPRELLYNALERKEQELRAKERAQLIPNSNIPSGVMGIPATNPLQQALQYLYLLGNR